MKKAYLKDLARELLGSVTDDPAVLEHFSTDASIFQITPTAAAYPANTADVRRIVEFARDCTAAGKPISLTARGLGADLTGGAIGEGISVAFPAHMNKLLRLEQSSVTVQPGISLHALQQTLLTHGRWLPSAPGAGHQITLGGALSADSAGPKSGKYGPLSNYVKSLKVVLADGSLIATRRLSTRELNRKRGLATFEGEIYRKLTNLLSDHASLITKHGPGQLSTGYALGCVRGPGNTFDLGQLLIGAQGTLGLITEMTLTTAPFHPRTTLIVGGCDNLDAAGEALTKLQALGPSALEFVDRAWLETLRTHRPGYLDGVIGEHSPRLLFFVEFDDASQLAQKFKSTRAVRLLGRGGIGVHTSTDPLEQVRWWRIRRAVSEASRLTATKPGLPLADGCAVPLTKWAQAVDKTSRLLVKYDLAAPLAGHAGLGHLAFRPTFELARKKDVDKLFSLQREFAELILSLGGSTTRGGGGLLHGPLLPRLLGDELAAINAEVKTIFDPHGLFNPHLQTGATESYARAHLRSTYTTTDFADHPPGP